MSHPRRSSLLAGLLAAFAGFGSPLLAASEESFSLQEIRAEQVHGPYLLRDGDRLQLGGAAYQMRLVPPDRLSFISLATGRVYGPVQTIEGRLVEIDGRMYAFSWRVDQMVPAPPPRAPLPPAPRAPPRPEPIPIPPLHAPEPLRPRTALPPPRDTRRATFWIAPTDDTPMNWKVDGRRARDVDLARTTVGGALEWRGWMAELHLSPSVDGGELLPQGMDVVQSDLGDGTGWLLAVGYRRPLLVRGDWEVTGGARASLRQDALELTSNTAFGRAGTNETVDVSYATQSSDITLTEFALWLDIGLAYAVDHWGIHLDLAFQPLGTVDVDGGLAYGDRELPLKADRDQPLSIGVGGWLGWNRWRVFGDFTTGSDQTLRIGMMVDL
ncbi:MAG: hypothetical protein GX590_02095 [Lentisphaerae bacterium]|nr:hypothetical protein [Lentisphaerota bacterium]